MSFQRAVHTGGRTAVVHVHDRRRPPSIPTRPTGVRTAASLSSMRRRREQQESNTPALVASPSLSYSRMGRQAMRGNTVMRCPSQTSGGRQLLRPIHHCGHRDCSLHSWQSLCRVTSHAIQLRLCAVGAPTLPKCASPHRDSLPSVTYRVAGAVPVFCDRPADAGLLVCARSIASID